MYMGTYNLTYDSSRITYVRTHVIKTRVGEAEEMHRRPERIGTYTERIGTYNRPYLRAPGPANLRKGTSRSFVLRTCSSVVWICDTVARNV